MDFKLKLSDVFKKSIVKIDNTLLLEHIGDKRIASSHLNLVSDVIDCMGIASAKAQGLQKPITSAEKLRNSDHVVYLLLDPQDLDGRGSVVGLLKMGQKKLYVFDRAGTCHYSVCLCVLDFYIHESRQRQGCGKILFEYMLNEENITPEKLAIDRPSDKFLSFLRRHYGLDNFISQNNNFVVFPGFFKSDSPEAKKSITPSSKSYEGRPSPNSPRSPNAITYNGRHAAHKPETTIGKCLNWYTPRPKPQGEVLGAFAMCTHSSRGQSIAPNFFTPLSTFW